MSTLAVNSVTDANGGNTATINSMTPTSDSLQGFRNRILNGDMRIDQRNAGAAVTTNGSFPVDRFILGNGTDAVISAQQDSSAPSGFVNSTKITITTEDSSLGSTQQSTFQQRIEGTNVADLAWGTANAKTVTLSFWVRSSLTGTFGGAICNSGLTRSYPFTYSISAADTWEYKTVTVAGDTSGTWLTTTGIGLYVLYGLGAGVDRAGTAGSWADGFYASATGAVSVIGTLNATWYVTGVQLEVGSVATPFERRPYGQELSLCQRYYQTIGQANLAFYVEAYISGSTIYLTENFPLKVNMRSSPTVAMNGTYTIVNMTGSPTYTATVGLLSMYWQGGASAGRAYFYPNANSGPTLSAEL